MGLFKDMKDLTKQAKDLQKSSGMPKPTLRNTVAMGKEALADVAEMQQRAAKLQTAGKPGTATITGMRDTGRQINLQPELEFDLEVEVNGFTSTVTHSQPVAHALLGSMQPGGKVSVLVDPDDTSTLMITGPAVG